MSPQTGRRSSGPSALLRALPVALLAALPGPAQQPAAEAPRVRSAAALTLVNIDVVVTRKDGTPVEGLTAADFVVLHDGRPVAVTNFREEKRGAAAAGPAAPAAAGAPEPEAPVSAAVPVAVPVDRVRRHLLFFFDDVALPEARERESLFVAMKTITKTSIEPGDDAMIVTWRRGIRRVFAFAGDVPLLERRLDAVARDAGQLGAETQTELDRVAADDAFYAWAGEGQRDDAGDSRLTRNRLIQERYAEVRAKLGALKGLMAVMSGLEGRKTLLLVSRRLSKSAGAEYEYTYQRNQNSRGGFPGTSVRSEPVSGVNTRPFIDALTRSANAAGVTIHAIYAEAWSTALPSAASSGAGRIAARTEVYTAVPPSQDPWMNEMTTLGLVTEKTGGVVVGDTRQAPLFAERVASDLSHWYSIGYPKPEGSGTTESMSVRAKRPGLEVRSRREFVERPAGEVMRERVLAGLFRKDEAARLPIAVSPGAPVKEKKDRWRTPLLVRVPVRALALLPDGDHVKGAVTIWWVSATPAGEVSDVMKERHELRVPADSAGPASTVVFNLEMEVEAADPASRISVCVEDATSGDAGFRLIRPGG